MISIDKSKQPLTAVFDEILIVTGGYIAGGAIRSVLEKQMPRDIDIMFRSEKDFNHALAKCNIQKKSDERYAVKCTINGFEVNLCKTDFGNPEDVIQTFDFDCCKAFYNGEYHITERCDRSIKQKSLTCSKVIDFPFGALLRLQKYIKYGYEVPPETLFTIARGLNEADKDELFYKEI